MEKDTEMTERKRVFVVTFPGIIKEDDRNKLRESVRGQLAEAGIDAVVLMAHGGVTISEA